MKGTTIKKSMKTNAKPETKSTVNTTQSLNPPTADSITKQLKKAEEMNSKAQLAEDKRLYKRFKGQIDKAYQSMENSYLQTAFALHAIYKNKLYRLDNFKNIYDFAKENYSIARGTCNNFINICEKFGVLNENGNIMELSPNYSQYSISQLAVMLSFPQELLLQCKSSQSVRDLKRMKQNYENRPEISGNTLKTTESANEKDISDSIEKQSPDTSSTATKLDIEKTSDHVFVCQASSVDELFTFREVIADTFYDIVEGNKKKSARLELRIVF